MTTGRTVSSGGICNIGYGNRFPAAETFRPDQMQLVAVMDIVAGETGDFNFTGM